MTNARFADWNRRLRALMMSAVALSAMAGILSPARADDRPVDVLLIGDSYISGWGIDAPAERFPGLLASSLAADGHPANVVDVGFRATSKDGLRWLTKTKPAEAWLADPGRLAVVLELGLNDCGVMPIEDTRGNLHQILALLVGKGIPVLMISAAAYDYCGAEYAARFPEMFRDLSTQYGTALYPDFKDGVTGHAELLHADGDHANSAGEAIIVARILPSIEALIAKAE